jgi:hypothetical protein
MARWRVWFECVGKAVCAQGLKALVGLVPLGEALFDIAANALGWLREQRQEEQLRASLEEVARGLLEEVAAAGGRWRLRRTWLT